MEAKHLKGLLGELERLAKACETGNFSVALNIDGLSGEERKVACLFDGILKNYQAATARNVVKHELTSRALGLAHWDLKVADDADLLSPNNKFVWSPELRQMFGFPELEDVHDVFANWVDRLHPDEHEWALRAFAAHVADRTGKTPFNFEHRMRMNNGEYLYVRAFGATLRDAAGAPLRTAGAVEDVTSQKQTWEKLREAEERDEMLAAQAHWHRSILDAIPLPIRVADTNMNLAFVNSRSEDLFGKKREEILGRHCSCWNVPICNTDECSVARAKKGMPQTFFEYNGSSFQVITEFLRDLSGEVSGYLEILHDITEIENRARQQAEASNAVKSAFLATISHEMRTPLNAVIGLSELTLDSGDLSAEAESNIENVYNAGSTLLSIVNDILDISKMESGKFDIIPSEYEIPSLVNDAIAQNLLRIGGKPIRFVLDIDENMPAQLYGDDLRVKQIINNLLSNAFKYTEKGTVTLGLSCKRDGDAVWMTIRVSDTGVGIRPEYRKHIFSNYAQFDTKANRKAGGTGLGLTITKKLAEMMDGQITAASSYGKGSIFTVKIRQQAVSDAVIGADLAESLRGFRYAANKRGRHSRLNRIKLPYARVLVVDDLTVNLDVAKGLMRPYGMRIDCVTSGQRAVDAIREEENKYGAVFMDHMMPGMDGIEATRLIREIGSEYAVNLPIIALTANAIAGNEEMFLRNGFNAFISKPIDMARLDEVIRRFVRDKDKEQKMMQEMKQDMDMEKPLDRRSGQDRRLLQRRGQSVLRSLGGNIDGLDIHRGLKTFGDDESLAQVLQSYATNTKVLLESIREVDQKNLPAYAITVHGIKGSSRGIFAEPVGRLAEALEHAARAEDFDFLRANNPSFLETAWNLVDSIETMLGDFSRSGGAPKKDRPDGVLLARLHTACDTYDMDGVDAALAQIAAFEYETDPGLVDWLRENVNRLNFSQIKERIATMR